MRRVGRAAALAATVALAGVVACGQAGDERPAESADTAPRPVGDHAAAPSTRVALPGLFGIMMGLQEDLRQISRGLWIEDFDTIAAGARSVAEHPRIPPDEFERVSGALGSDLTAFAALDTRVHDLSVRMGEEAAAGDLEAVLATDAEIRGGCVACHTRFRVGLREALGAP